ncbi:MAG: phage holin family protein [Synergistaceae bacterium]|nr:phage holin family protein [Synergistaceae bacterium]
MEDVISRVESEVESIIYVVGMAVVGGLASFFKNDDGHPNWGRILAAVITSAFSGLLSYEITYAMGFDIHIQSVVAGISGYGGGTMLDEAMQKLHDIIMKHADDKFGGKK